MKKIILFVVILLISSISLIGCQGAGSDETPDGQEPGEGAEEHEVALYFSDTSLNDIYREYQTVVIGKDQSLEVATLEAWIKGPKSQFLVPLANKNTKVLSVKDVNGIAEVNFSKEIMSSQVGSSGEAQLIEQITMAMQQFGYGKTAILIEGEIVESLAGHVDSTEPFYALTYSAYLDVELLESEVVVAQNNAFKLFTPAPNSVLPREAVVVRGLARIWEASFSYELADSASIRKTATAMASEGAPGWGEFEFTMELDQNFVGPITLTLYESSAIDGSPINQLEVVFALKD